MSKRSYHIVGETFHVKGFLYNKFNCVYVSISNSWKTPVLEVDTSPHAELKRFCKVHDLEMIPTQLSPECQKIQDILSD